jgi:hypothetical protein
MRTTHRHAVAGQLCDRARQRCPRRRLARRRDGIFEVELNGIGATQMRLVDEPWLVGRHEQDRAPLGHFGAQDSAGHDRALGAASGAGAFSGSVSETMSSPAGPLRA